jgi:hypothetical protein
MIDEMLIAHADTRMRGRGYRVQMRGDSKFYTKDGVSFEAAVVYSEIRLAELEYAMDSVPLIMRGGGPIKDALGKPVFVRLPTSPRAVRQVLLDAGAVTEELWGELKAYLDLGDGLAERVL